MAPLLAVWRTLTEQIRAYNTLLRRQALQNDAAKRLMTVPGVGPIVALAFTSMIDEPGRFAKSKSVGAYLGLAPRRYQSGENDVSGSISRTGDTLVRSYLFEAANVLMTRVKRWTSLKAWGVKPARRIGISRARAAVARKMAVVMHTMLVAGTDFVGARRKLSPHSSVSANEFRRGGKISLPGRSSQETRGLCWARPAMHLGTCGVWQQDEAARRGVARSRSTLLAMRLEYDNIHRVGGVID